MSVGSLGDYERCHHHHHHGHHCQNHHHGQDHNHHHAILRLVCVQWVVWVQSGYSLGTVGNLGTVGSLDTVSGVQSRYSLSTVGNLGNYEHALTGQPSDQL